jgi:hypothetical protein
MAHTYRNVTHSINDIISRIKMEMMTDFVAKQVIDVLLLLKVSTTITVSLGGYALYYNIGTSGRGTATLTRTQPEL